VKDVLLAAIREHPDDDLPRLAFADWLEEQGELERSSFIRRQIELARWPEWDPRWQRAYVLDFARFWGLPWRDVLPPLPRGLKWDAQQPYWRGFPDKVVGSADAFREHAEEVAALAPVQSLVLEKSSSESIVRLARSPALARLRTLSIVQGAETAAIRALGESPHAEHLEQLELFGSTPGEAIEALVATPLFGRLLGLNLSQGLWSAAAQRLAAGLARLRGPCRLQRLNLEATRCGPNELAAILDSPLPATLTELHLANNQLGPEAWQRLTSCAGLTNLHTLNAGKTNPGRGAVRALLAVPWAQGLRSLTLSAGLDAVQVPLLAGAEAMRQLSVLGLAFNTMGDRGAEALASSPYLSGLARLDVAINYLSEAQILKLVDSAVLANVVSLDVRGNGLSPKTARNLRRRKNREIKA
jgi:uncharacterized protein (TIGR02996 family)